MLAQSIQYIIAIIVPLPKRHTCIKLRDHQLYEDCTVSFLGCYEVEKRIDKSKRFLDLGGNMLTSILLITTVAFHLLF